MKILLGALVLFFICFSAQANISSDDAFRLDYLMGGVASEVQLGTMINQTKNMQAAEFDATDGKNIGTHDLDIVIPDNAVITNAWYDVVTTFTSANDSATLAIKSNAANDIVTATAISAVGNIWDVGIHAGIPVGTAATSVKMTSDRIVQLAIAAQSLTAGKLKLFVEYVNSI